MVSRMTLFKSVFIDREAGEIIRLVASVCLFVCKKHQRVFFSRSIQNGWTFKIVVFSTGCAIAVDHAFNVDLLLAFMDLMTNMNSRLQQYYYTGEVRYVLTMNRTLLYSFTYIPCFTFISQAADLVLNSTESTSLSLHPPSPHWSPGPS